MAICPNCRTNNADGAVQCAACGAPMTPVMYGAAPATPGKGLAVASLVMGILATVLLGSLLFGVLAVVFGGVSKNKGYYGGMATAGVALGIIGIAIWLIVVVACGPIMFGF